MGPSAHATKNCHRRCGTQKFRLASQRVDRGMPSSLWEQKEMSWTHFLWTPLTQFVLMTKTIQKNTIPKMRPFVRFQQNVAHTDTFFSPICSSAICACFPSMCVSKWIKTTSQVGHPGPASTATCSPAITAVPLLTRNEMMPKQGMGISRRRIHELRTITIKCLSKIDVMANTNTTNTQKNTNVSITTQMNVVQGGKNWN